MSELTEKPVVIFCTIFVENEQQLIMFGVGGVRRLSAQSKVVASLIKNAKRYQVKYEFRKPDDQLSLPLCWRATRQNLIRFARATWKCFKAQMSISTSSTRNHKRKCACLGGICILTLFLIIIIWERQSRNHRNIPFLRKEKDIRANTEHHATLLLPERFRTVFRLWG